MSLFELGADDDDIVETLKVCLRRRDYNRLNAKAKILIVRYDNPLIIAYSDELDDEELIKLTLETFQTTTDTSTIHLLGDIISILARRPKNLMTLVNNKVMNILLRVVAQQSAKEILFVNQILNILIILLEYDDIRILLETDHLLHNIIPQINTFTRDKDFAVANLNILKLCCANDVLMNQIIRLDGPVEVVKAMNMFAKEAQVACNGAAVLACLIDNAAVCRRLLEGSITAILTKILHHNFNDEKAALEICRCLRKLMPFKRARIEAEQQKLAAYLGRTITKHTTGNLAIVQFAFVTLAVMSSSAECRQSCRSNGADEIIAKCIENFAYNSALVRDGCIALASLIYNGDHIKRFISSNVARALSRAARTLGDEDHRITLRILASAYKEASLYDVCVPSIIENSGVEALMTLLNFQYTDKTIVCLILSTLAKISLNPMSFEPFLRSNASLVIPSVMARYMERNWVVIRYASLVLRNLSIDSTWQVELVQKDSFKQIVRSMVYYLKNCKSIILVSLEALHRILSAPTISPKLKDERVVKALNIVEQRFHRTSHTIATLAADCMHWIGSKPISEPPPPTPPQPSEESQEAQPSSDEPLQSKGSPSETGT